MSYVIYLFSVILRTLITTLIDSYHRLWLNANKSHDHSCWVLLAHCEPHFSMIVIGYRLSEIAH